MSIHKLIFIFLIVGCTSNYESRKLLRVVDVTGAVNQNSKLNMDWDLSESRSINFSACVIDKGRESVVKGQTFKILKPDQTEVIQSKTILSDDQGCVHWTESFSLDPLAQPSYITTPRILEASSFYHPITLNMGINFWSGLNGTESAVENLDKGYRLLSKDHSVAGEKLITITKAQINLNLENSNPRLQISFSPFIDLLKMDSKQQSIAIQKGLLKIKPQIIAVKSDGSQTAFSQEVEWTKPIKFNNNFVSSEIIPLQFGVLSNDVTYYLSLQVEPLNGPPSLRGQKFLLKIGNRSQLLKTKTVVVESDLNSKQAISSAPPTQISSFDLDLIHAQFAGFTKDENQTKSSVKINLSTRVFAAGSQTLVPNHRYEIYSLEDKKRLNVARDTNPNGALYWSDVVSYSAYNEVSHEIALDLRVVDLDTHEEVIRHVFLNPWIHRSSSAFFHDINEGGQAAPSNQIPILKIMGESHTVIDKMVPSLDSQLDLVLTSDFEFNFLPQVYRLDDPTMGLKATAEDLRPGKYRLTLLVYTTNADRTELSDVVSANQKEVIVDGHQNFSLHLKLPFEIAKNGLSRSFAVAQIFSTDHTILRSVPLIFPIRMENTIGFNSHVDEDNWIDKKIKNLANALSKDPAFNIEQRFVEYKLAKEIDRKNTALKQGDFIANGYVRHAHKFGLQALEVGAQTPVAEGYDLSTQDFKKGLECLEQASWQYESRPALCLTQIETQRIIQGLCNRVMNSVGPQAMGNLSMPTYDMDQSLVINQIKNRCLENAANFFRVEKQIYVYQKAGQNFRSGFVKTVNFYTAMAVGFNKGNSLGDESNTSYTMGGTALLTLGSIFNMMTTGVPATTPVVTREKAVKDSMRSFEQDSLKSPRVLSGSRKYERFKLTWETELELNEASLAQAVSYNLENLNATIEATQWRTCYAVFPDLSKYRDQIVGVEDTVKDIKKYYCFPVETGRLTIYENFYVAHPTDGGGTSFIDGGDQRNFGQTLVLKGTRDFQALFQSLKKAMPNHHLAGVARDTRDVWNMVQVDYRQHLLLEDTAMVNAEPPRNFNLYGPAPKPGVLTNFMEFFNLGKQNTRKNLLDQNDPDQIQFR